MATAVGPLRRLVTDERDAALARDVLVSLEGPLGHLSVERSGASAKPLPPELGRMLQEILQAVASGSPVTVTTIPREVTTSTAAAMLEVSRPTLMKLVRDGVIDAHKVGTHTRLLWVDVTAAKKARRARERAAFAALLEAEGDEEGRLTSRPLHVGRQHVALRSDAAVTGQIDVTTARGAIA
ncbi:helix-turn-helix domain-containing protein [Cellulomonas fimi]|uniref:Helix-turn-helix domain-containing protein n=1 Tax=Cellulomonas fimi TaxID=1708 RepID=A0A7Y0LYI4_CELFI|nr:helix-turn-helix domain-containing protein [Cellulomonas fimi]NMR19738.1 helix-turn-helix domain-containing protein [Cellulomonas fimi]